MRNKKKTKETDKSKRNKPVEVDHSEEIGSVKNIESKKKSNKNNTKESSNIQKTNSNAPETKGKGMEQNVLKTIFGTQEQNTSKSTQLKNTNSSFDKNSGVVQGQDTSLEKNVGPSKPGSSNPPEVAIDILDKYLTNNCEDWLPIQVTTTLNDVNKVRHFFERDPKLGVSRCDPNGRCLNDGCTVLLLAIRTKHTEAARVLLENGADVTLTDNSGDNALMAAIKSGDANIINLLWPFRRKLDINHTNYHGLSALHLATDRKWECCMSFLLQNRANPNCRSMTGTTPLMLAAANGDRKAVDILVKCGADILLEDSEGNTCVCKAIHRRKDDMAQYLLHKIPDDKKEVFLRSRLEMLMRPPSLDQEKQMMDCYYPILHQCTQEPDFRNAFYNTRATQKVTQKLEEHDQNIELAIHASHIIFCSMFGFSKTIDIKIVKQFLNCKGPDVVIRITKFFTEVWKIPEREIIIVFLPMLGLSELLEGRIWLKKNYVSVSEYLNFFERDSLKQSLTWNHECHWAHDCKYIDAINSVWLRFHDVMSEIQTEEREKHMAELLDEEAREKEKLIRKREKKKQKKQEKQRRQDDSPELEPDIETELDPVQTQSNVSEVCLSPKDANTNAGRDDSRGQKKKSDCVSFVYQTAPSTQHLAEIQSYNVRTDFPQQNLAEIYCKPEQWTTIQTKRQLQKEKEKKCMKRQTECMQVDIQDKAKKTPQKSPKKKNFRSNQNLFGQGTAPVLISGNTRWADVAKGVAKKNVRQNFQSTRKANNLYSQRKAKFGETDFPSLNDEQLAETKNYIQPAKFTFTFHEPIVEPQHSIQNESFENEAGSDKAKGDCVGSYMPGKEENDLDHDEQNHANDMAQYDPSAETGTDIYEDLLIDNVEAEYCSVWDADMDNNGYECKEMHSNANDYSQSDQQLMVPVEAKEQDNVRGNEYGSEDWSEEIREIEMACTRNESNASYELNQHDISEESSINTARHSPTESAKDRPHHSDISSEHECTSNTTSNKYIDYVGPEHCQVDINTIIKHQTTSFPYFEEYVLANRINDPFFDPTIPLPPELAFVDDKPSNTVDALFEVSEEIPSWFNDDNAMPTHEKTWNEIQENTSSHADNEPAQHSDIVRPADPAIIGYKQMQTEQVCKPYEKAQPVIQLAGQHTPVMRVKTSPVRLPNDQSSVSSFKDVNEAIDIQETCGNLSKQEIENIEKQTAVIKPLQTKSKGSIPVSNSAFGQTLLENACRLEQMQCDDDIGYPEDLGGVPVSGADDADRSEMSDDKACGSRDDVHFPGFHSGTKLSAHFDNRDVSIFHRMQQVQLEQLARYYNQYRQQIASEASSVHQDNFVYHASCAGVNRKDVTDCLNGKMDDLHVDSNALDRNTKENKTFKDIRKQPEVESTPEVQTASTKMPPNHEYYTYQGPNNFYQQMLASSVNRQMPQKTAVPLLPMGQYLPPAMHPANIHMIQATQAAMAATVMNQIKEMYKSMMKAKMKSVRWREELSQLRNLPPEKQMVVGKIVIPKEDCDRISILRTSSGPLLLGFLTDGTEVAVKVIDWTERDFTLDELQHLVNLDVSKYFMNKYKAFCSQDGHYFIAMDLYEYSLSEYLRKLGKDSGVDQTIARNKLVWQFLRGLASLHQHCLMVHGELRPENVVIDLEGNVRITGYGLGKNISRDTPFVECNDDEKCWLAPEVLVRKQKVSFKSDIFVSGMLMYYILSGGKNPFGSQSDEIIENISEQAHVMTYVTEEAGHLLSLMLSVNKSERPCISDALRHPYFWADEKRLRFILISGSDVLRDLKAGIPMDGSVRDSMISIIGTTPCNIRIINWIDDIESVIMREMRVFRQYKNNVVELVLFIYNCCLHFDKMSDTAREIIDEPCKYFLNKFPPLFMTVYRAIKMSNRTERTCYKPFF